MFNLRYLAIAPVLACAEHAEVLGGLGTRVCEELKLDSPNILVANRNVHEDDWIALCAARSLADHPRGACLLLCVLCWRGHARLCRTKARFRAR